MNVTPDIALLDAKLRDSDLRKVSELLDLFETMVSNLSETPAMKFDAEDVMRLVVGNLPQIQNMPRELFGTLEVDFVEMMINECASAQVALEYYYSRLLDGSHATAGMTAGRDVVTAAAILTKAAAGLNRHFADLARKMHAVNALYAEEIDELIHCGRRGIADRESEVRDVLAPVKVALDRMQHGLKALRTEMAAAIAAARHALHAPRKAFAAPRPAR